MTPDFGFVDKNYLGTGSDWWVEGAAKFTGDECTDQTLGDGLGPTTATSPGSPASAPGSSKASTDPCPVGQLAGQVNGSTVCYTPAPDVPVVKKVSDGTTVTNPDGSTTTTTNTTTTTCTGAGSCSSTVSTVTSSVPAGGGTATSTTTQKVSTCTVGQAGCNGTEPASGFLGSCAQGFSCTGDAVMCATARAANDLKCNFFDKTPAEQAIYNSTVAAGTSTTGLGTETTAISSANFDQTNLLPGGSCVADKTVTVMGRPFVVQLSLVCPSLTLLGNLGVALSLLTAMMIVFRRTA
jgi:hypothetical protein